MSKALDTVCRILTEVRQGGSNPKPGSRSFSRKYIQKPTLSPSVAKPITPLAPTHDELVDRAQGTDTNIKEESLDEAPTSHVGIVKKALEAHDVDSVGKNKEGHVVVRKGYFYTNGGTSEKLAHQVTTALTAAGVKHEIVKHGNHWAPFRGGQSTAQGSHWHVHVKLHEDNLHEDLSSPYHRVAQHIKSHYPEMKSNVDAWHNDVNNGGDDTEAFHKHFGTSKHRDWLHSVMHNHGIAVDFIHKEEVDDETQGYTHAVTMSHEVVGSSDPDIKNGSRFSVTHHVVAHNDQDAIEKAQQNHGVNLKNVKVDSVKSLREDSQRIASNSRLELIKRARYKSRSA